MTVPWADVAKSTAWSGSGAIVLRLGQLVVGIIAARVMVPHDFGLFAIAMIVYGVVVNVSDLGTGSALIREQERLEELAPTAVTMSIVTSLGLTALMFFGAPAVASALGGRESTPAIQVMSLVVLLAGPTAVPAALMTRNFRMDLRFWADLLHFVTSSAVMLVLAVMGYGAMALAWSRVAGQVASAITLFALSKRLHRPGFNAGAAKHLFKFGWPLIGTNLLGYTLGNVDSLVIARGAGPIPLGTYTLASNVSAWPLGLLEPIQMNVGLPLLSRARSSMEVLNRTIGLCMALLASTYFFGSAMIAALADPIVAALYGQQWAAAGPILSLLAGVGFLRGFLSFMGVIVIASNATVYQFWLHVIWIAALTPCVIVGVFLWGAPGAAIAHLLVDTLVMVPVAVVFARRASGMAVRPLIRAMVYPVLCSAAAAVVAHVVSTYVSGPWFSLVAGGFAGCALYAVLIQAWLRRTYADARALASLEPEEVAD